MTADEIKDQIIQKQDKYIKHFKASYYHSSMSFRYGNFFFSRKVKKIEKEIASLRQQLEECKELKCRDCSHLKKIKNRPCNDCEDYDLWEPIKTE